MGKDEEPAKPGLDGPQRYTAAHVLVGLGDLWAEHFGGPPVTAELRMDEQLRACGCWDELDFADVARIVDSFFGIDPARPPQQRWQDWTHFLGLRCRSADEWDRTVGPRFTFGALAEFLAGRIPDGPPRPLMVLGRPCAAAGTFLRIRALAAEFNRPALGEMLPSTPIMQCLAGRRLQRLWAQLRWMSNGRLPPLPRPRRARFVQALKTGGLWLPQFLLVCGGIYAVARWGVLGLLLAFIGLCLAIAALDALCDSWPRPDDLPEGCVTFRDLSRLVASGSPVAAGARS